jgi:DNA-binding NtrC family response regulator
MKQPGKILVIDDDPNILKLMTFVLEEYSLKTAGNGEEGLKVFEEWEPDLVLLDQNMPGMSGLEVIKVIQKKQNLLPVLVMTGMESVALASAFMRSGALDYIVKPIDPDVLKKRVDWAINTYIPEQILILQEKLQSKQDEVLGKWSSMVRHRVNNFLQIIKFSLDELQEKCGDHSTSIENFIDIKQSAEGIKDIMDQLENMKYD